MATTKAPQKALRSGAGEVLLGLQCSKQRRGTQMRLEEIKGSIRERPNLLFL